MKLSSKSDIKENSFGLSSSDFKLGLAKFKDGIQDFNPSGSNGVGKTGVGPYYFNLYSDVGKDGYKLHQMIIYSSDKAYIYLTISS